MYAAKDVFAPLIDIEPLEAAYKLAEAAATADPASRTRATEALKAKRALEAVTSDPAVDRPAFWPSYEWVALREDKSLDSLPGKMFPGTLLMRLGCTEERKVQESADQWKEELGMAKLKRKRAFVVKTTETGCVGYADSFKTPFSCSAGFMRLRCSVVSFDISLSSFGHLLRVHSLSRVLSRSSTGAGACVHGRRFARLRRQRPLGPLPESGLPGPGQATHAQAPGHAGPGLEQVL